MLAVNIEAIVARAVELLPSGLQEIREARQIAESVATAVGEELQRLEVERERIAEQDRFQF